MIIIVVTVTSWSTLLDVGNKIEALSVQLSFSCLCCRTSSGPGQSPDAAGRGSLLWPVWLQWRRGRLVMLHVQQPREGHRYTHTHTKDNFLQEISIRHLNCSQFLWTAPLKRFQWTVWWWPPSPLKHNNVFPEYSKWRKYSPCSLWRIHFVSQSALISWLWTSDPFSKST